MMTLAGWIRFKLAVVLSACVAPAAVALGPAENGAAIHRRLSSAESGFSGQVVLERDGVLALDQAYGIANGTSGAVASPETLYYIGSLAKMFTSAVVLLLESDAKLSLADPISRHLESVPEDKRDITIRQLLTHTSGVIANHPDPFTKLDRDSFLTWFMSVPLANAPGEKHNYSNVGYSVLAAVVERAAGAPFTQVVRQRVFVPAKMDDTWFVDELGAARDRLARGMGAKLAEFGLDGNAEQYGGTWLRLGPGGIVSTARDLLQWERALRSHAALSAAQYAIATTPWKPGEPWGMGWRLSRTTRGTPLHFHDGGLPGFHAAFARFPEEKAVVIILSNRDEGTAAVGRWIVADFLKP